ncbi:hypothetical protein NQ314_000200 [Rhamnusium bicolor]|uniref:Uncharacterized protein n=1 Tax=Rhamnusium bicolor TaxID=1586634 RepID=A0AAV8ZZ14_9CUCU|nr:hypothetical protein NQ314_000200 [Rhamnusium bicolor]
MASCRLCLSKTNELKTINTLLSSRIKKCVSIEINDFDNLPKTVCVLCIQKIDDWFYFKEVCINSNKQLKLEMKNGDVLNVKQEIKSVNDKFDDLDSDDTDDDDIETSEWSKGEELVNEECFNDQMYVEYSQDTYVCEICSKLFDTFLEYLDHKDGHNGQPAFNCHKCKEVFTTRLDLDEHGKKHQNPCPVCGTLILNTFLKLHLMQHTDRSVNAADISKEDLRKEIAEILKHADFSITSVKTVRLDLEEKLHANLDSRRREIDELVMDFITKKEADKKQVAKKTEYTSGHTSNFLSPELAALVGAESMSKQQVVRKIWTMIKEKDLYDHKNKQYVICDDALMKVIGVRRFRAFDMMKYLKSHFIS